MNQMDLNNHIIGLTNDGNTCYINSTLQLLLAVPGVRDAFYEKTPVDHPYHRFFDRWKTVIGRTRIGTMCPRELIEEYKDEFEIGEQHDGFLFLLRLIQDHDDLFRVFGRYSPIEGKKNIMFKEPALSLPVTSSLSHSFESYFGNGGGVYQWPPVLLIHFKRHGQTYRNMIDIPTSFRVMSRAYRTKKHTVPSQLSTYYLRSVVVHTGNPEGDHGHYLTVVNSSPPVLIDDRDVTEITADAFKRLVARSYIVLFVKAK